MSQSEAVEANLRELFSRGSEAAGTDSARFHRLVSEMRAAYAKDVAAVARKAGPNSGISEEDVCAETWAAVAKDVAGFKGGASFRTWVLGIANNKLNDGLRGKYKRHDDLPDAISKLVAFAAPASDRPSRALVRAEIDRHVREAIAQLDEEDQELLRLHFLEGQTWPEIVRSRNMAPNTAAQRVGRLLRRLKEQLDAAGISSAGLA